MTGSEFEDSDLLEKLKVELEGLPASPFYVGDWLNEEVEQRLNELQEKGVHWPLLPEPGVAVSESVNNGDGEPRGWLTFLAYSWEDIRRMGGQYLQLARHFEIDDPYLLELFELALCINEVKPILLKKRSASQRYKKSSGEVGVCRWCWREVPPGYQFCHIHDDGVEEEVRKKASKSALKRARKLFGSYRAALSELRVRSLEYAVTDIVERVNIRMKKLNHDDYARFLEELDNSGGPGYLHKGGGKQVYYMCYDEESLRERLISGFGLKLDDVPEEFSPNFLDQALLRAEAWLTISSKPY